MSYDPPEIGPVAPCPRCGCRAVCSVVARPGQRERPLHLRCSACGEERGDLEFTEQAAA